MSNDIIVKLTVKKKPIIKFKFSKNVGKEMFVDKDIEEFYRVRKEILVPTKFFTDPYWQLQNYVLPYSFSHFAIDSYKKVRFVKGKYQDALLKRDNIDAHQKLTIYRRRQFRFIKLFKLINNKKASKIAVITRNVYMSGLEDILLLRELTSKKYKSDIVDIYDYQSDLYENNKSSDFRIYQQLGKYHKFNLIKKNNSFCDCQSITSDKKYNFITFNVSTYLRSKDKLNELVNNQNLLNVFVTVCKKLEKGGNFTADLYNCQYGVTIELMELMAYYFEEFYLVKAKENNPMRNYFTIIGKNFGGINEKDELNEIINSCRQLFEKSSDCGRESGMYINKVVSKLDANVKKDISKYIDETRLRRNITLSNIVNLYNRIKYLKSVNEINEVLKGVIFRNNVIMTNYLLEEGLITKAVVKEAAIKSLEGIKAEFKSNRIVPIMITFDKNLVKNRDDKLGNISIALEALSGKLKKVKRLIDNKDDNKWSKVSYNLKMYRNLKKVISKNYLGGIFVSQAFIKMSEILRNVDGIIVKKDVNQGVYRTFSICEAPGQFVLAINHYLKTVFGNDVKHEWLANSLNPLSSDVKKKFGNVFGNDYNLMRNHMDRWLFGKNGTGDVTKIENIKEFKKLVPRDIKLMTSDCGLQMRDEKLFLEQETYMTPSNLAQIVCALYCMPINCNFVFKTFLPAVEILNVSLLYLVFMSFKKVVFYKPVVNPGSSEFYVVGIDYKGSSVVEKFEAFDKMFKVLRNVKRSKSGNSGMIDLVDVNISVMDGWDKDEKFMSNYTEAIGTLINKTSESIYRTLLFYDDNTVVNKYNKELDNLRNVAVDQWIKFFKFKKLNNVTSF